MFLLAVSNTCTSFPSPPVTSSLPSGFHEAEYATSLCLEITFLGCRVTVSSRVTLVEAVHASVYGATGEASTYVTGPPSVRAVGLLKLPQYRPSAVCLCTLAAYCLTLSFLYSATLARSSSIETTSPRGIPLVADNPVSTSDGSYAAPLRGGYGVVCATCEVPQRTSTRRVERDRPDSGQDEQAGGCVRAVRLWFLAAHPPASTHPTPSLDRWARNSP
eukprot:scaffold2699_cov376-Prasinococcus_capsulatus_cf.AAC.5